MESKLEENLHYIFKDKKLLKISLTHRSSLNEEKKVNFSNERLEFLGDAVIELVVSKFLYKNYPKLNEGRLTSLRSALVKTESLALESEKLKVGDFIKMSNGEESTGGRTRPYILANTFEAIVGAIYLDSNITSVTKFLEKNLFYKINEIFENDLDIDPKSKLQELVQEKYKFTPKYSLIISDGPDHEKRFEMGLIIKDIQISSGVGNSKQNAEKKAAETALRDWKNIEKILAEKI